MLGSAAGRILLFDLAGGLWFGGLRCGDGELVGDVLRGGGGGRLPGREVEQWPLGHPRASLAGDVLGDQTPGQVLVELFAVRVGVLGRGSE